MNFTEQEMERGDAQHDEARDLAWEREQIESRSHILQAARRLGAAVTDDSLRMPCGLRIPIAGIPATSANDAYRAILFHLLAGQEDRAGLDAPGRVALFQSLPQGRAFFRAGEKTVSLDLQGISKDDAKIILNYLLNK